MAWLRLAFTVALIWLISLVWICLSSPFQPGRAQRPDAFNRRDDISKSEAYGTNSLKAQFRNPAETLGILLLIGGDIIQKAIAQLAGRRVVPVAFSFGWISYSFSLLLAVWGDGHLMPQPDCSAVVIDSRSGNTKQNESWVIGRLIRDLELHFNSGQNIAKGLGSKAFRIIKINAQNAWVKQLKNSSGDAVPDPPHHDTVWWSFLACAIVQLALALSPIFMPNSSSWRILLVTCVGTLLAFIHGSLPQWKEEKYDCAMTPAGKEKTYIITRGNSHQYVFVIHIPAGVRSLNLEHLAVSRRIGIDNTMLVLTTFLAICWIMLLVSIGGLDRDTWFLLGVGAVGMLHNILVAGFKRKPAAHGIPLDLEEVELLNDQKGNVMDGLKQAESKQKGLGLALLKVFFPGRLNKDEEIWWKDATDNYSKFLAEKSAQRGNK